MEPDAYRYFAHNLRLARISRGLSQRGLAPLVPTTQGRITQVERGLYPRPGEVEAFAKALGVPVADLLRRPRARLLRGNRVAA